MSFDDNNPFEPGADPSPRTGAHGEGTLEPVPMEIGAILQRAWDLFMDNIGVVLGALLIPVGINMAVSGLDMGLNLATIDAAEETQVVAGLIRIGLSIVGGIVGLFLQLGVIRIFANLAFGRDAEVGMLFTEGHRFLSGLGASILVGIITVIGMILLIVPGVIASLGLYFTLYLVIDQEMGAIDALSESWRLTDGEKGFLFVFNLLMVFGALILMVVTCGIGYLIVVPTLALVQAVMYHSLVSMKGTAANPTSGFAS